MNSTSKVEAPRPQQPSAPAVRAHQGASEMEAMSATRQSTGGADPRKDARRVELALQNGLASGAQELEALISRNPDPAYREALLREARPFIEKMGELFAQEIPGAEAAINGDPEALRQVTQEAERRFRAYSSLSRATELLGDAGARQLADAFARRMPSGVAGVPNSLLGAISRGVQAGHGTRLAVELSRSLLEPGGPQARATDSAAVTQAMWAGIDLLRAEFAQHADKVAAHTDEALALMSGVSSLLTPEQQQQALQNYRQSPPRGADYAAFEDAGRRLATVFAGLEAPPRVQGPTISSNAHQAQLEALTRELPRLAQSEHGAVFLQQQLQKRADGQGTFLDYAVGSAEFLKDGKDFTDRLSQALAQTVASRAIFLFAKGDQAGAQKMLTGLAEYGAVFGLSRQDMKGLTDAMGSLAQSRNPRQFDAQMDVLQGRLRGLQPGTPGGPDTVPGQALRALSIGISTLALYQSFQDPEKQGFADRVKRIGDGMSLAADGAALGVSIFGRSALMVAADRVGARVLGPLGTALGAAADGLSAIAHLQERNYGEATASGLQSLGGGLLAASLAFNLGPGTQIVGAGLFIAGLAVKYGVEAHQQQAFRDKQVAFLDEFAGLSRNAAEALVYANPARVEELKRTFGMSLEQMQSVASAAPVFLSTTGDRSVEALKRMADVFQLSTEDVVKLLTEAIPQGIPANAADRAEQVEAQVESFLNTLAHDTTVPVHTDRKSWLDWLDAKVQLGRESPGNEAFTNAHDNARDFLAAQP
jgi:hypothetical protein